MGFTYTYVNAGSAVLHGITQHLLQIFEAQVPAQAAQNSPYSGSRISSRGSEQNAAASPGWQGKAASAVVALSEVVFGASSAWQGMRQQHSQQKNSQQQNSQQHRQQQQQQHHQQTPHISSVHSDKGKDQAAAAAATEDLVPAPAGGNDSSSQRTQPSSQPAEPSIAPTAQQGGRSWSGSRQTCDVHNNSGSSAAQTALHDDSGALEPIVVQALDEFSNAGVWSLATHLDADAAVPGNDSLTPQVHQCALLALVRSCTVADQDQVLAKHAGFFLDV